MADTKTPEPVAIRLEFTPNPDSLKYAVSRVLLERGALAFTSAEEANDAPLAARLFAIQGVDAVMIGRDFVTLTVGDPTKMPTVNAEAPAAIQAHLEAGEPVVSGDLPEKEHGDAEGEVARRVIEILDAQVRPAVARDGGDIVFDRFEAGVVYLRMKGACSGCPSSMATLKQGIEHHLRQQVPGVEAVEAAAM